MAQKVSAWFFILPSLLALYSPFQCAAQSSTGSYTTTADVPLRAGPGSNYQAVTTLPKGIKINVIGRDGSWLKVESRHGGKPGYVDEQFARPEVGAQAGATTGAAPPVVGSYRTLREIELHEKPAANSQVVAKLPAGIKVNVSRAEGEWLRVESKMGGKPGYLEKKSVERWQER